MCVACVIFSPVSLEYLEAMEDSNPHGAGIAWFDEAKGKIRFVRGLTAKDIHQLQSDNVMSYPYLMHYRWATHGAKVPELTHPFPIGPRALLGELSGYADSVLIHNGTWGSYEKAASRYLNQGNYEIPEELIKCASDTAVAAWLAQSNPDILDEIMWATAIATVIQDADGKKTMEVITRGTWSDKDGNWYSNLNWEPWAGYAFGSFPGSYYSSDSEYQRWVKRYDDNTWGESDPSEPRGVDGPVNTSDIDWDEYFKAPFSTRGQKDQHLNFDQFVERYRRVKTPVKTESTVKSGGTSSGEMSWNDYLVAKYGAEVATQIQRDCFPPEDGESGGECRGFGANDGYNPKDDPEAEPFNFDPDLVSEDWETVNTILARQMADKWSA